MIRLNRLRWLENHLAAPDAAFVYGRGTPQLLLWMSKHQLVTIDTNYSYRLTDKAYVVAKEQRAKYERRGYGKIN